MRTARIDLYKDNNGKWRWRYISSNGRVLADSGQGYRHQGDAVTGMNLVLGGAFSDGTYGTEFTRDAINGQEPIPVRVLP